MCCRQTGSRGPSAETFTETAIFVVCRPPGSDGRQALPTPLSAGELCRQFVPSCSRAYRTFLSYNKRSLESLVKWRRSSKFLEILLEICECVRKASSGNFPGNLRVGFAPGTDFFPAHGRFPETISSNYTAYFLEISGNFLAYRHTASVGGRALPLSDSHVMHRHSHTCV